MNIHIHIVQATSAGALETSLNKWLSKQPEGTILHRIAYTVTNSPVPYTAYIQYKKPEAKTVF